MIQGPSVGPDMRVGEGFTDARGHYAIQTTQASGNWFATDQAREDRQRRARPAPAPGRESAPPADGRADRVQPQVPVVPVVILQPPLLEAAKGFAHV